MEVMCSSIRDTAKALGVGRTKVYELINSGRLETIKIGRRTLVKAGSIRELVNA